MMRKTLSTLLFIPLLISCSNQSSEVQAYKVTKVLNKIEDETFNSALPTQLPFKLDLIQVKPTPKGQPGHFIEYVGKQGQMIELFVTTSEVNFSKENFSEVSISDLKGWYTEKGPQILAWEQNTTHYKLSYYSFKSDKDVTKQQMIQVAESLELIEKQ
ncbi:hypothetical protein [Pontibacillus marinus]|uniref:DUF4367 domain-containing protein n=1 Tax=Pontibacillus marinus BH030004 = DSM 16465 TaxID=1385511 RepID=A0A0A5G4A4_9BACI|nr:hypothetical protein [Pontibacillus marinus]KGX85915.1 hypothetical protein N783_13060 [Pontibacillus marinus BH030004 = DSM 16465]